MQDPGTLMLGSRQSQPDTPVELPAAALLRHVMALGSSGSGKTVLSKVIVEEAVRHGLPALCIDPQGDLCSLALGLDESAAADTSGAARMFADRADVVVFTPASHSGIALGADPVNLAIEGMDRAEVTHAISRTAGMITRLLGYDPDSDDGTGLGAVFDRCLQDLVARGRSGGGLAALCDLLEGIGEDDPEIARYVDPKKLSAAKRKLARLDVGARRMLFHEGLPIDIDLLLGLGPHAQAQGGRTRVAIVYLNSLQNQEDKDFFVAALADRLYAWMLQHPSSDPQALFYIDEVAPFLPPVRKPASKPGLQLLFKQARKYGVCCLMATQNPGDVDYKSMAQFGTWAIGRLTTRQDLKKVGPTLQALAPTAVESVMSRLPALRPGQFVVISPDSFDAPCELQVRRLYTPHETLQEDRIAELADERWRRRFAPLMEARRGGAAAPGPAPAAEQQSGSERDARPDLQAGPEPEGLEPEELEPDALDVESIPQPKPRSAARADLRSTEPDAQLEGWAKLLARKSSMTVPQFAAKAEVGQAKARSILASLVGAELAGVYVEGRSKLYWAFSSGARPDLGLGRKVLAARPVVDHGRATQIGASMVRTKVLGLIGEDEHLDAVELVHRLVYKLDFEEKIQRSLFRRMFGDSHDHLLGSVYVHPHDLRILVFSVDKGLRFESRPAEHASAVEDLDGAAELVDVAPGGLAIDPDDWQARKAPREVKARFKQLFAAVPGKITPVFVPLWRVIFRQGAGTNFRVAFVDALAGRPVEWSGRDET